MLGSIGKSFTSHMNNIKRLSSKEVQSLPLSERLKIAHEGSKSAFKGEEVFLSNSVTNFPPPLPPEDQEESFVSHPEQITNQPQVQLELPFKVKDNTTGENYELQKNGNGPALAILTDDSPKMEDLETGNENKKDLAMGKGMKVIDGEVYLNGRIMDPETGEPGDKGYWTYGDKVVTGKKAEIIGGDIFVDGKEWDPATGEFTGTIYNSYNGRRFFGKDIRMEGGDIIVDGKAYNPSTGGLIENTIPSLHEKTKQNRSFRDNAGILADGITKGTGLFVGGILGAMGAAELVAAGTAGTVLAGPVAIAALLIIGTGAAAGTMLGYKGGKKVSDLMGKAAAWIGKKPESSEKMADNIKQKQEENAANSKKIEVTDFETSLEKSIEEAMTIESKIREKYGTGMGSFDDFRYKNWSPDKEKEANYVVPAGNSGPDILAPGVDIKLPIGDFKKIEGTDFSAPLATGTVATMLEANPDLTPGEIKEILNQTAGENKEINPESAVTASVYKKIIKEQAGDKPFTIELIDTGVDRSVNLGQKKDRSNKFPETDLNAYYRNEGFKSEFDEKPGSWLGLFKNTQDF